MTEDHISKLVGPFGPSTMPRRSGVYWACNDKAPSQWGFAHFDAELKIWGCLASDPNDAARSPDYEFASQLKRWRGLPESAKAGIRHL